MVDKHIFDKQFMDLDSDSRLLPPNATREVYNLRSGNTSTNGKGCLETLKSMLEISTLDINITYTPPTGINWVEGKCQDVKNSALLIFVRNQNGHDAIYRIWSDNRIELIAQYDYFAFDKINHANVLGNLLYWTDGYETSLILGTYNPPRKFNIVRASAMTNQFTANKLATYNPSTAYSITTTKPKVEYLGNLYELKQDSTGNLPTNTTFWRLVRTKFVTGEIVGYTTTLGVKNCYQCLQDTTVELPTDTTHWKLIEYKHYDSLTLQLITRGKVPPFQPTWTQASSDIKINRLRGKIFQFRTRFIYDDDEKSTWSCISTPTLLNHEYNGYFSDPSVNNTLLVTFGTGTKEVVRIQVACRINGGDWVLVEDLHKYNPDFSPVSGFTSDSTYVYTFRNDLVTLPLDQTETNNLFSYTPQISSCQELIQGNRLVDADITEGYDYPSVTCALTPTTISNPQPVETVLTTAYSTDRYVYTLPAYNTLIKVSVLKFTVPISTTKSVLINYYVKNETTLPQILTNIVLEFANNGITALSDGVNGITVTSTNYGTASFSLVVIPSRVGGLKYSSTVNPGIIFFDELKRSTSVVKLPSVDIPSVNDTVGGTTIAILPVPVINFTLSGTPPIQAYSYKFCHTENRYAYLDIAVATAYISVDTIKRQIKLNIDQAVIDYRSAKPNSVVEPWVYVKGDRIRLLGYSLFDTVEYFDQEIDLEILSVDSLYTIPYQNINFSSDIVVEIYRDVTVNSDPSLYFECGEEYLITNPRTSIRAYATTSGQVGMYDAFQRSQSASNSVAYIVGGNVSAGVQIFDTSNPLSPVSVSKLDLSATYGVGKFVTVSGNYMYVLSDNALKIYDISNIASPVLSSTTVLDYADAKTVRLNAGFAYIVHGTGAKLSTINVTSPTSPNKSTPISVSAGPEDIAFRGVHAYISSYGGNCLDVINISDPTIPVLGIQISGLSNPRRMNISGNYLFVANSGANTIRIYSLLSEAVPVFVSSVAVAQNPYAVVARGNYAYSVSYNDGSHGSLQVIDILSISSPGVAGTVTIGTDPFDLYVAGKYAYTANYTTTNMSVVDLSDPHAPVVVATSVAWNYFRSVFATGANSFNSIESKDYSDLFKSDFGDKGRVAVHSLELKRKRIIGLKRWSGVYLQNTNKNDLSFVDVFNYEESPETFGAITKIFEYGDILTIRQAKKNSSYYLSAAVLKQAQQAGVDIISSSTEVLGSKRQSTEVYGCANPESHVSIGTINYYADIDNGIIRDGYSESVNITEKYGLNNFIKALFNKIKGYYPKIVGGYDRSKGELWYTIYAYIAGDVQKWTIMFNEDEKAWKAYFDWVDVNGNTVDCYGSIGQNMYAFNQGFWAHEKGTDYSKFFGVSVTPTFKIIGKGNGKSVFRSLSAISNIELKCDSILIFDNDTYLRMQSKLPKMIRKEKYWYSAILRNQITNSATPSDFDLYNGDVMRGDCAEITLQPLTSGLLQVFEVNVNTEPSL